MRTAIVPAQITTVEDRIAGSLTFSQVILLMAGLIVVTLSYLGLRPTYHFSSVKLTVLTIEVIVSGLLALRIRERLVISWASVLLRYLARPRVHVFRKLPASLERAVPEVGQPVTLPIFQDSPRVAPLSFYEQIMGARVLDDPAVSVSVELGKKGGLNVAMAARKR